MRTTRALIAGFGATGTMVAAAACVFVVASAVIAFNGWPGSRIANRIDSLFVKDQAPVGFNAPGPQVVAGSAAAAAATVAAAPVGPVVAPLGLIGGAVKDVTGTAGKTVGGVNGSLGNGVSAAGQSLGDAVGGSGDALGGALPHG